MRWRYAMLNFKGSSWKYRNPNDDSLDPISRPDLILFNFGKIKYYFIFSEKPFTLRVAEIMERLTWASYGEQLYKYNENKIDTLMSQLMKLKKAENFRKKFHKLGRLGKGLPLAGKKNPEKVS